jgi:hypothetical protein
VVVVVVVMVGVSNTRMLLQTRQWYYYFAAGRLGFRIYQRDLNAYITPSTHETWRMRCRAGRRTERNAAPSRCRIAAGMSFVRAKYRFRRVRRR